MDDGRADGVGADRRLDAARAEPTVDDEPLVIGLADLETYERELDFRDGLRRRSLVWCGTRFEHGFLAPPLLEQRLGHALLQVHDAPRVD